MEPGIQAHLELNRTDENLAVSAWVSAPPESRLRWRLTTVSRTSGGRSQVSQGGLVSANDALVGVVTLNRDSTGEVTLAVFDGEALVAEDKVQLQDGVEQP